MKKNTKVTKAYLTQKESNIAEVVFISMTVVGAILILLYSAFYFWPGFWGIPLLIIGGGGFMFLKSSKITEDDFDNEVKKIVQINGVEENDTTLKEYIIGKSMHIKKGRDKRIRTAYYCVTVFSFKNEECTVKKHVVDIFEEKISTFEYKLQVGCDYTLKEKMCPTPIGEIKQNILSFDDRPETEIPVDVNIYDTDAVIKKVTHKR